MADTHRIHRQRIREVKHAAAVELANALTAAYDVTVTHMTLDLGQRPTPAEIAAFWTTWLALYESTE